MLVIHPKIPSHQATSGSRGDGNDDGQRPGTLYMEDADLVKAEPIKRTLEEIVLHVQQTGRNGEDHTRTSNPRSGRAIREPMGPGSPRLEDLAAVQAPSH
jgi:hypothetical protein